MKPSVSVGQVYSGLTVINQARSVNGRAMWNCQCRCGNAETFSSKQLTTGVRTYCSGCQDSGSKSPLSVRLKKYKIVDSGCWEWAGKRNKDKYGVIVVNGVTTRAHRAMYFMLNPSADRSKIVMHTCDNPSCVNPDHLKLGTQSDNIRDAASKGRLRGGAPIGNTNARRKK